MNNVVFNSGIIPQNNEQQVCKNVIEKFGNAMINHDVRVLKELFEDFFANVGHNFKDFNVIKTLNKMNDILFDLNWHDWDENVIDEYVAALGKGQSKLMAKYS
jgi:hypothetical protein